MVMIAWVTIRQSVIFSIYSGTLCVKRFVDSAYFENRWRITQCSKNIGLRGKYLGKLCGINSVVPKPNTELLYLK